MKTEAQKRYMRGYYKKNKDKALASAKIWYDANREKMREYKKKRYEDNKEEIKAQMAEYRERNREKHNACSRRWSKNNPGLTAARNAKRHAQKLRATPKWLTSQQLQEIKDIYLLAKELQWLSEEPLEVDHIIPLQGKNVCGLHVPENLQILPKSLNIKKFNKVDL